MFGQNATRWVHRADARTASSTAMWKAPLRLRVPRSDATASSRSPGCAMSCAIRAKCSCQTCVGRDRCGLRIAAGIERLADDRRVDPHLTERERLEHHVPDGLRVLRGVQDGAEMDALPGQAAPERLEPVAGLTVAHRDRREDEVPAGSGSIRRSRSYPASSPNRYTVDMSWAYQRDTPYSCPALQGRTR